MLGAGKGGGLKITSKIAKYIQHLKTGIEGNAMHQGPLEMLTVNVCFIYIYKKKNKSKSLLPCLLRQMRPSSFPAAFCYPFGSLVPLSTQVCQAMTADRYKLICPRASWHMNSGELCELEEKEETLPVLPRKVSPRPPPELHGLSGALFTLVLQSILLLGGRGMPCCSKLACSQVHMEAFQATQLLTALQLLFHAVLLYITLLSLPGGTAVLQYNRLAKSKTDFFTSQIPTDCYHCSHNYKPCPVLDFPTFVHVQEILIPSLLFSLLPNLLLLPSLSCSTALSVEGSHPQHPAQDVPATQGKMPQAGHEVHYQASRPTVAPNTVRRLTRNIVVTLSFNRNLSFLVREF